jgi:hypothetical protein
LYLLYRLHKAGFTTVVFDEAGDVGGTRYWNRYPGARSTFTLYYSYTFDPQLEGRGPGLRNTQLSPKFCATLAFSATVTMHTKCIEPATEYLAANAAPGCTSKCGLGEG